MWIIMAIGVTVAVILSIYAIIDASNKTQDTSERMKLINGEISVFQYCSHIGKAAVDDENCKEFNLLYGPNR